MHEKQPSDARVEAAVAAMNKARWMGVDAWRHAGGVVLARSGGTAEYMPAAAVGIAEKFCGLGPEEPPSAYVGRTADGDDVTLTAEDVARANARRFRGVGDWEFDKRAMAVVSRGGDLRFDWADFAKIAERWRDGSAAAENGDGLYSVYQSLADAAAILRRHRHRGRDSWAPCPGDDRVSDGDRGVVGRLARRWAGRYAEFEADSDAVAAVARLNAAKALGGEDWRYDAGFHRVLSRAAGVDIRPQVVAVVADKFGPPAPATREDAEGPTSPARVAAGLNERFHLGRGDWRAEGGCVVSEPGGRVPLRFHRQEMARAASEPLTPAHVDAALLRGRRHAGHADWHAASGGTVVVAYLPTGEAVELSAAKAARLAAAYRTYDADPANDAARSYLILRGYDGRYDWKFDAASGYVESGDRKVSLAAVRKIAEDLRAGRFPRVMDVGDRREVLPDAPAKLTADERHAWAVQFVSSLASLSAEQRCAALTNLATSRPPLHAAVSKLMTGGATDKAAVAGPEAPLVEIARGLNHAMLYGEDDWKVEGDSVVSRRKSIRLSPADALRIFPAACQPPPSREEVDEAVKVLNAAGYGGSSAWRQDYEACRVIAGGSQSFSAAYAVDLASSTALRARAAGASTATGTIVPGACKVAPKVSRSGLRAALATILGYHPDGFGASCDRMGLPSTVSIQAAREHAAGIVCDAIVGAHPGEAVGA